MTVGELVRRFRLRVGVLAAAVLVTVTSGVWVATKSTSDPDDAFLARSGTRLLLAGKAYRYVGHTMPGLAGCGRAAAPDDAELDEALAGLPPHSMVRTWAPPGAGPAAVERVVAAARRHAVLLTIVLADDGIGCGPAAPPAAGGAPASLGRDWYREGFERSLLPWARDVASRFATATSIGMWEVAHAPGADVLPDDIRHLYDVVGGEIRRADPNHLVAVGAAPSGSEPADWRRVHDSGPIDVVTLDDYDMNPGAAGALADTASLAHSVGRPLVLVIGILASQEGDAAVTFDAASPDESACVSWTARVDKLRTKLDASFATPVAGAVVWSRPAQGWSDPTRCALTGGGADDPLLPFLNGFRPPDYPVPTVAASAQAQSSAAGSPVPETSPGGGRVLAAPTNLTVSRGSGTVTLCWTASERATAYVLYHRDVTAGTDWTRMPYPIEKPCWTGDLFIDAHVYEFQLRASDTAGESAASPVVRAEPRGAAPAPPTNLTASPGNGTVTLCWTTSADADVYVLYHRDVTAGADWLRMPYPIEKPCWTGASFVNGHAYEFQLRASNSGGESEPSAIARATPGA